MIPYGAGINSALAIGEQLGATPSESAWIVAAYPLTQGTFVLIGGRIGAIYGHKNAVAVAGIWWVVWTLISGFMKDIISLSVMRALSGVGGGFMVPNAVALLTITFPPGRMRNISVALFGAMAPMGAAGGGSCPGFFVQLLPWKWLFFFLAMLGTAVFILFAMVVPEEPERMDPNGKIDFVGAYLGVTGLILFNFVWNQAPNAGWDEPYEYALLIVSILHIAAFAVWEAKFAKDPILPFDIWKAPSFGWMTVSAFFTCMAVGIIIWYISLWNLQIRHYSLFLNAAGFATLAVCGAIAAILSAFAIRHLAAQYIMAIASLASAAALVLVCTMPEQQTYWAQVFPALILTALGPDFIFTASQIIASNTVKRSQQGIAGSVIGTIVSYGLSTGLGFAGTVEVYTNSHGKNPVQGYRNAMYLGIGIAGCAAVIALVFVRIPKDRKEGWDEED
ncbi:MFS general substrate transporter [Colletotrichum zoysiae]|uniref:MFS general substrate transporter n=1 Tax=Colletotrichum zoysiae TaxID=1216348 RepID=A0AAD9H3S2_9PEZI|nr:MFS general substrate transporter [Colletotrichum zoysiae]